MALPVGIALVGLVLNVTVAACMATTVDEESHVRYGAQILQGSADRTSRSLDSKMPVTALNAVPRVVATFLQEHGIAPRVLDALRSIRAARFATIGAAFCLSLLVYVYAKSLFGRPAGVGAQVLFSLSPNITAHSTLATTDLYCALATVGFLFLFRRFLLSRSLTNALLAASALAFAQLTKFVAASLFNGSRRLSDNDPIFCTCTNFDVLA